MRRRTAVLVTGLIAIVVALGITTVLPDAQAAAQSAKGEVNIELIVQVGPSPDPTSGGPVSRMVGAVRNIGSSGQDGVRSRFQVDSFFDVSYASNIGSSGIDGFQVDSFFDLEYRMDNRSPGTFDTEIVAMQLRVTLEDPDDADAVLDAIRVEVRKKSGDVYYGHVTVLK